MSEGQDIQPQPKRPPSTLNGHKQSSIDIFTETPLTAKEVAKLLPGRPHVSSVHRWMNRGRRGIRLEYVEIGETRYTSREALQRWFDRVTAAGHLNSSGSVPTTRTRQKEIDEAARFVERFLKSNSINKRKKS